MNVGVVLCILGNKLCGKYLHLFAPGPFFGGFRPNKVRFRNQKSAIKQPTFRLPLGSNDC